MPAERYYSPHSFAVDGIIVLAESEHHHLLHVMRTAVGEEVELVNGQGMLAKAELITSGKRESTLKIFAVEQSPPPASPLILAQAIPRLNRLDTIIEKGTELGMTELWLFPGEKGERRELQPNQKERASHVAIAAMKQCGALWLPVLQWMPTLKEWQKQKVPLFFGDLESDVSLWDYLTKHPTSDGAIFVTGPEAGFSERERAHLIALGAHGVKLHKNILRTDTASIAALSMLSSRIN